MPYKLLRVRKDGSLGPLFINRKQIIPKGEWLKCESHPTKGFAYRPGWHIMEKPIAPHLSVKDRAWYLVDMEEVEEINRPKSQGGKWYLAKYMKVIRKYNGECVNYKS